METAEAYGMVSSATELLSFVTKQAVENTNNPGHFDHGVVVPGGGAGGSGGLGSSSGGNVGGGLGSTGEGSLRMNSGQKKKRISRVKRSSMSTLRLPFDTTTSSSNASQFVPARLNQSYKVHG
ncbi:unnamed protein product [Coffea canephora]|uniref:Uncharacterized protein n=1 Tax=Coffea canephora TaxID=49390 RepID=A0A068V7K7_COFCA|nr:unnamed protein product [Coffea canephora]